MSAVRLCYYDNCVDVSKEYLMMRKKVIVESTAPLLARIMIH